MDEKRLAEIRIARGCGHDEAQELIRLARLGLWAEQYGVPALEDYRSFEVLIKARFSELRELLKFRTIVALDFLPKKRKYEQ